MKKNLTAHKIAKIKGAKISLWTNSPKLRAAKIKGFTVCDLFVELYFVNYFTSSY